MKPTFWPESLHRRGVQRNSAWTHLIVKGLLDLGCWVVAFLFAYALLRGQLPSPMLLVSASATATAANLTIGLLLGVYRNRYRLGGAAEVRFLLLTLMLGSAIVMASSELGEWRISWQVVAVAASLALLLMIAGRQLLRVLLDSSIKPRGGAPVVVVGAGEAGASLIRQMVRDRNSAYLPIALVDDDVAKRHVSLEGVPVRGRVGQLAGVVAAGDADGVIVAIGAADSELLRGINDQLAGTDVWIRTIPSLSEMINGQVPVNSLRELNAEDLLGRQPATIDFDRIRAHIGGRRVLVTGAGGSIGSEICRQLSRLAPGELMMLDRDESALHALKLSIDGSALMNTRDVILADIRDADVLSEIFDTRRPEVVFHAAALKHLPMLEQYPHEGWRTNVHGSLNVLEASRRAGVQHFVNISTDKAANPTSYLGQTKRIAERLTASYASLTGFSYLSVRFGNVLGSRGSVLLSFREQIEAGGPLTVTHPDVTRYFMTIPEASQLVLQAAVDGRSGETLVLDMGQPVRIVDMARRLMELSGRTCDIVYTGLREGEKLDEELFTETEESGLRSHEKISHVRVAGLVPGSIPPDRVDRATLDRFLQAEATTSAGATFASPSAHPNTAPLFTTQETIR